ncbi:MAG: hypothetical protein EA352_10325 [Gemmatimonadales bacterium]|nr:MAG: hypothetical protein EA352_10325 [Gemmatimonadales bacterium]
MRFDRIFVDRFGPLAGVDTGEAPLGSFVVVTGPNEVGKTSFFMAIRALMHGLYPASRDRNPWSPWDGSDLEVRADVTPARDAPFRVHRRLLSTPWGRLRRDGMEEDLRNEAIPPARRIGRNIHEQVYTIGLPELVRLQEGPGWEKVRDELVLGLGTRDLVAPRDVADALRARAEGLWRPDRRSRSTEDRLLAAEVEEASERLLAARDRDRRLRGFHRELGELEEELERLREADQRHRQVVEEARRLEGPARLLESLRHRREEAGDTKELEGLPADPVGRVEEVLEHLRTSEVALEEAREVLRRAEADAPRPSRASRLLLDREEEVAAVLGRRDLARELATRREEATRELAREQEGLQREAGVLLEEEAARELASGEPRVLADLPHQEVTAALSELEEARTRRIRAEEAFRESEADSEADEPAPRGPLAGAVLLMAGLPLLLATLLALGGMGGEFTPATVALSAGALAGLLAFWYGVHQVLRWRNRCQEVRRDWDEKARRRELRMDRLSTAREEEAAAREAVAELLAPLPLLDSVRRAADRDLPSHLRELASRAGRVAAAAGALQEGTRTERELEADLEELRHHLQDPEDPGTALPSSMGGAMEALSDRRTRAREEARRVEVGARAVEEARRAVHSAAAEVDRARSTRDELDRLLPGAGDEGASPSPESLRRRARRALERVEAAREARTLHAELVREAGGPREVARDLARLRDDPLHADPGPRALEDRIEADRARVEELVARVGELRSTVRELEEGETPDRVEAEIRRLEDRRERVREERDLAFLLSAVVRTAEREFRETHQPELVRRAGRFLSRITGGRYNQLLLGDESDPDALHLGASHLPGVLPVREPFSTGIREQVYLALRLAVLEVVEGGGEPLPLVLDEVLVNWDPVRREQALDLLAELSEERQIFLMTCHPHMAREARDRGARLVELEPGR